MYLTSTRPCATSSCATRSVPEHASGVHSPLVCKRHVLPMSPRKLSASIALRRAARSDRQPQPARRSLQHCHVPARENLPRPRSGDYLLLAALRPNWVAAHVQVIARHRTMCHFIAGLGAPFRYRAARIGRAISLAYHVVSNCTRGSSSGWYISYPAHRWKRLTSSWFSSSSW